MEKQSRLAYSNSPWEEICQVPRQRFKEGREENDCLPKGIRAKHNLETKVVEADNVLIKSPLLREKKIFKPSFCNRIPRHVIVMKKNNDVQHASSPIPSKRIDGEWLKAKALPSSRQRYRWPATDWLSPVDDSIGGALTHRERRNRTDRAFALQEGLWAVTSFWTSIPEDEGNLHQYCRRYWLVAVPWRWKSAGYFFFRWRYEKARRWRSLSGEHSLGH